MAIIKLLNSGFEFVRTSDITLPGTIISNGFEYGRASDITYQGPSNNTPTAPMIVSPAAGIRIPTVPTFIVTASTDKENDDKSYRIQICPDTTFTTISYSFDSTASIAGWEYSEDNQATWIPFPSNGYVPSLPGPTHIKYTAQTPINIANQYYWRCQCTDNTTYSFWDTARRIVIGDTIDVQFKTPVQTSAAAIQIVPNVIYKLPTDGVNPATFQILACNNGNDVDPTWEDITSNYFDNNPYMFTNKIKTDDNWAINMRVIIKSKDSTGTCEVNAFGMSFN